MGKHIQVRMRGGMSLSDRAKRKGVGESLAGVVQVMDSDESQDDVSMREVVSRDGHAQSDDGDLTQDDAQAANDQQTRFSLWDFATRFRLYQTRRPLEHGLASNDQTHVALARLPYDGSLQAGVRSYPLDDHQLQEDRDSPSGTYDRPQYRSRSFTGGRDQPSDARHPPTEVRKHVLLDDPSPVRSRLFKQEPLSDDSSSRYDDARKLEEFMSIVEDMRAYLVGMRTQTEDDQIEYGTSLNRAVLGYRREREAFLAIIQDRLASRRLHRQKPPTSQYETMAEAVFAEVIGMNVLESVMREREDLEEIQVVGTRIFEVRNGFVRKSPYRFRSADEVERLQQNLVLYNRDTINTRKRWAEVSLPDGARVTMTGFGYTREPTITIRFFPLREVSLSRLVKPPYSTLDEEAAMLLQAIVAARLNIIVIGATNTGKSHLLKALIADIPDEHRIVTIEPRCELLLGQLFPDKNIVEFEAPDEDAEHGGGQAFRLALRQSPERIILAEIRDQEANLYVRSCTRGHMGSMTTAHVNALEDVPDAITDMCMLDKRGMNPERLRRRIAQFVTQIGIEMRIVAGQRKVVRIGEISECDGKVHVRDLIVYDIARDEWRRCHPFSETFGEHIRRYSPEHHELLHRKGWVID